MVRPSSLRSAAGPVAMGLAVWCAAGRISLAAFDQPSIRLAVPAPWWVAIVAIAAAFLVPAWRRRPALTAPALLSTLPWLPLPLPAAALIWTGPLAWMPIGLAAVTTVLVSAAAITEHALAQPRGQRAPLRRLHVPRARRAPEQRQRHQQLAHARVHLPGCAGR